MFFWIADWTLARSRRDSLVVGNYINDKINSPTNLHFSKSTQTSGELWIKFFKSITICVRTMSRKRLLTVLRLTLKWGLHYKMNKCSMLVKVDSLTQCRLYLAWKLLILAHGIKDIYWYCAEAVLDPRIFRNSLLLRGKIKHWYTS